MIAVGQCPACMGGPTAPPDPVQSRRVNGSARLLGELQAGDLWKLQQAERGRLAHGRLLARTSYALCICLAQRDWVPVLLVCLHLSQHAVWPHLECIWSRLHAQSFTFEIAAMRF